VTADIIAWLNSPEGEAWSRARHQNRHDLDPGLPPRCWQLDPGDPAEDPTGRPPITPAEQAALKQQQPGKGTSHAV
jgi:hypothetical protein